MTGFITSYVGMFERPRASSAITGVQIPLIQRDYAQGRSTPRRNASAATSSRPCIDALAGDEPLGSTSSTEKSRTRNLQAPGRATAPHHPVPTPLVPRVPRGQARPGQRRGPTSPTRLARARGSSAAIVESPPPADASNQPRGSSDQPWYLHLWRHDPTIQSMLGMIDSIDETVRRPGSRRRLGRGWLTPTGPPSLLPTSGRGDGLRRGALHQDELAREAAHRFETFKARFEKWIEGSERRPSSPRRSTARGRTSCGRSTGATTSSTTSS